MIKITSIKKNIGKTCSVKKTQKLQFYHKNINKIYNYNIFTWKHHFFIVIVNQCLGRVLLFIVLYFTLHNFDDELWRSLIDFSCSSLLLLPPFFLTILLPPTLGAAQGSNPSVEQALSQAFTMMNFQQFELSEIVKYKQN